METLAIEKRDNKMSGAKVEVYKGQLSQLEILLVADIKNELLRIGKLVGSKHLRFTESSYSVFPSTVVGISLDEDNDVVLISDETGVENEVSIEAVLSTDLSSWDLIEILDDLIKFEQL